MKLPWWLKVVIFVEVLPLFLGPIAVLVAGDDAMLTGFSAAIYSARNIAVGVAFIVAYALRSAPMLFILIVVRLITDLIDMPAFVMFGMANNNVVLIGIFVTAYYIPATIALRYLWKRMATSAVS